MRWIAVAVTLAALVGGLLAWASRTASVRVAHTPPATSKATTTEQSVEAYRAWEDRRDRESWGYELFKEPMQDRPDMHGRRLIIKGTAIATSRDDDRGPTRMTIEGESRLGGVYGLCLFTQDSAVFGVRRGALVSVEGTYRGTSGNTLQMEECTVLK